MLKGEWGVKSNGKLPHLFIPSKTATFVPEFAVEDLPFWNNCRLCAWVRSARPVLGQNTLMIIMMMNYIRQFYWSENFFRHNVHLKFSVMNIAEPTWNAFSKQLSNSVQQSFVEITERLFKKAVPIHFVNYFTTNNILWT